MPLNLECIKIFPVSFLKFIFLGSTQKTMSQELKSRRLKNSYLIVIVLLAWQDFGVNDFSLGAHSFFLVLFIELLIYIRWFRMPKLSRQRTFYCIAHFLVVLDKYYLSAVQRLTKDFCTKSHQVFVSFMRKT